MEIRQVEPGDSDDVTAVARTSMSESYNHLVDQDTIVEVATDWYSSDRLGDVVADENERMLVAADGEEIVGFAHGSIVHDDPVAAELQWLHVAPSARGQGIGVQLLGQIQDEFGDLGAAVFRGMVISGNEAGAAFFEDHGFDRVGTRSLEIGDDTFEELVFRKALGDDAAEQVVERIDGPEGESLFVNFSEAEHASAGPLYPVYLDSDLTDRYGFRCGNCGSLDMAMDPTGRALCADCGNKLRAKRWDASYL